MATVRKVLGQSNPSAATVTDIYTVPAATDTVVSCITVCNRSATATSFRIAVSPAGAAIANEHYIMYDIDILGNEGHVFVLGITLAATDKLRVYATLATLSFSAFGEENS